MKSADSSPLSRIAATIVTLPKRARKPAPHNQTVIVAFIYLAASLPLCVITWFLDDNGAVRADWTRGQAETSLAVVFIKAFNTLCGGQMFFFFKKGRNIRHTVDGFECVHSCW